MATSIIPTLQYRDAPAAIEWLCSAFGFEKMLVVPGEDDTIAHARLTLGAGMVMVQTTRQDAPDPSARFGICVVVEDADVHYARARAAGADIVTEIEDHRFGGRGYSCRDIEGVRWTFSTHDPWTPL